MLKSLFLRFLKDRILLILLYLLNIVCVLLFFHLSEPANNEYFYPLAIGLFFLSLYLFIDWFRFYPTGRAIEMRRKGQNVEWAASTEEQKAFQRLLHRAVSEYTKENNELKEQSKERISLLSHWMHHLKTPVSVIELILNNGEKTETLEKIQQENKRLHTSIEQGLTMIRMDQFGNDFEVQTVDLVGSLRKLINARKKEWIYQSLFPSIESSEEDAFIITDPKWNEIMIDQIITNAIKYSSLKEGNKKLVFKVERVEDHIHLSIIDEGVGIPPYDIERVFQPFFTGENGRQHRNSTGIGLYLSKKIADKTGAKITIQSVHGEGTTVILRWLATGSK
ncbi:sensor histidine kinase [Mesobacillus subterraneus]|uniref:sensor histidine kinase n=1 Tax=Mesobacillus subterraneus TaxID=285983 RepID=UPI001CFF3856|nr:sensor histidine kinase [Mesobacillus subterraneus]WLR57243.1 sensor histidine kinase [Mesobacillus subterraneus]